MSQDEKSKKVKIEKLRKILDDPDSSSTKKMISDDEKNLESIRKRLTGEKESKQSRYSSASSFLKSSDNMEPRVTIHEKEEEKKEEVKVQEEQKIVEFEPVEPASEAISEVSNDDLFDSEDLYEVEKVEAITHEFVEIAPEEKIETSEKEEDIEQPKILFEEIEEEKQEDIIEDKKEKEMPKWEPVEETKTEENVETPAEEIPSFEIIEDESEPKPEEEELKKEIETWEPIVETPEEETEIQEEKPEPEVKEEELQIQTEIPEQKQPDKESKKELKLKQKEELRQKREEQKKAKLEQKQKNKQEKIEKKEVRKDIKLKKIEMKKQEKEEKKKQKQEKKAAKMEQNAAKQKKKEKPVITKSPEINYKEIYFNEIKSIDEKTSEILFKKGYNSVDKIRDASVKELSKIRGISNDLAKSIKSELDIVSEWESYPVEETGEAEGKIVSGYKYGEYTLYKKEISTSKGKKRVIHFFSKKIPAEGEAIDIPEGYEVKENKRTGLPYLSKKK